LQGKIDFGRRIPVGTKNKFVRSPLWSKKFTSRAAIESMVAKLPTTGRVAAAIERVAAQGGEHWISPERSKLILPLSIEMRNPTPGLRNLGMNEYSSDDYLVVLTNTAHSYIKLPNIQWGQYGDGDIAELFDSDDDGNVEVWFVGEWGECDEDSAAGAECAKKDYHRLEQFGGNLAPFVQGRRPKNGSP
jgi:hypothetical protein